MNDETTWMYILTCDGNFRSDWESIRKVSDTTEPLQEFTSLLVSNETNDEQKAELEEAGNWPIVWQDHDSSIVKYARVGDDTFFIDKIEFIEREWYEERIAKRKEG